MNKSSQTKQHIIESAFMAFTNDPRSSLADVARQAGVGRATLHRHFNGRGDLLDHMYLQALTEMDRITADVTSHCQSYGEALETMFKALVTQGHHLAFVMGQPEPQSTAIQSRLKQQHDELMNTLVACRQEGMFNKAINNSWIMTLFEHLIHAGWEWHSHSHSNLDQAADQAWAAFIRSVR